MKAGQTSDALLSRRVRMVLVHLAEEARRDLELIPRKPVHAVHALRTRMKQLRALLELLREGVPKTTRKDISALAKRLKDKFAGVRDAHVIATLRASIGGRRQVASYQKRLDAVAARPSRARDSAMEAEAGRLARKVGALGLEGLSWEKVLDAYVRSYRSARNAMKACKSNPVPERFHKWRRPVKDLFFQSHALRPADGMKRRARLARRLADRLGDYNDLDMLEKSAGAAGRKGIIKRIAKRKRSLEETAFKIGAKLFSSKPRELARELEAFRKHRPREMEQCLRQA
jgi:CHAD domain-containing protein